MQRSIYIPTHFFVLGVSPRLAVREVLVVPVNNELPNHFRHVRKLKSLIRFTDVITSSTSISSRLGGIPCLARCLVELGRESRYLATAVVRDHRQDTARQISQTV